MLKTLFTSVNKTNFENSSKKEPNAVLQIIPFGVFSGLINLFLVWAVSFSIKIFNPSFQIPETTKSLSAFYWVIYELSARTLSLIGVIVASLLCIKLFTNRRMGSLGFFHKGFLKDCLWGCLISFLMISLVVLAQYLGNGTEIFWAFSKTNPPLVYFLILFFMLFVAATFEEVMFRGYPLQTLAKDLSPQGATLIMSSLFALVHVGNPNATFFSTANTFLAGILLSVAYFKTRSLWLAIGLHVAWNFSMGAIYGLPVSGIKELMRYSIFNSKNLGQGWFTGADYGPEGGAITTVILFVGIVFLIKFPLLKISGDMKKYFNESDNVKEVS